MLLPGASKACARHKYEYKEEVTSGEPSSLLRRYEPYANQKTTNK
jgi:hypothetical protein